MKKYDTLIATILCIPLFFVRTFTMVKFWEWFVVSTFDVCKISMATAYGFMLIYSVLTLSYETKETDGEITKKAIKEILQFLVLLLVGFITHMFI